MNVHVFARVNGKLARWAAPDNDHEEAIATVWEEGVKGPVLALIEGGPSQIIVPADPSEAA